MSVPPSPAPHDDRVAAEQVRMVYNQLPVTLSGTLVASTLLVIVLWQQVSHTLLVLWLAAMLLNQAWRLRLFLQYRSHGIPDDRYRRHGGIWAVGAAVSGTLWGAAAMLFMAPQSPVHQTIVAVLVFAMAGTGVALLAPHRPSFYAFFVPTLCGFVARNVWEADTPHLIIAFIGFVMMLSFFAVGRRNHAMIVESLGTRFRNLELVERLQQQNVELDRSREVAEQASRAKTRFFAAASHDLRQPLHALGLFASALAERIRDCDVLHVVHSINASVIALDNLFDELLDISKIDAGVIKPNLEHFPIQRVLDKLALDFEPEAAEKGLRLFVRPCAALVHSDPILLERVLRNLLTNALRYTPRGGVLVGCRLRPGRLDVEVWDTGVGIPAGQTERIFEEFYQLANPERSSKHGMGLGLSIVRRICLLLGYDLRVASQPGRGSVFRFEVPLGRPQGEKAPATGAMPLPSPTRLEGVRIVVVDDESAIVSGMQVLLEGWGARVFGGATADEAIRGIGAGEVPDLLLTDLHLQHEVSGFDVVRTLRDRYGANLPAILVTGSASPEHAEAARAQALHFLLKPVHPGKLRTLINFKLQQRKSVMAA